MSGFPLDTWLSRRPMVALALLLAVYVLAAYFDGVLS